MQMLKQWKILQKKFICFPKRQQKISIKKIPILKDFLSNCLLRDFVSSINEIIWLHTRENSYSQQCDDDSSEKVTKRKFCECGNRKIINWVISRYNGIKSSWKLLAVIKSRLQVIKCRTHSFLPLIDNQWNSSKEFPSANFCWVKMKI